MLKIDLIDYALVAYSVVVVVAAAVGVVAVVVVVTQEHQVLSHDSVGYHYFVVMVNVLVLN